MSDIAKLVTTYMAILAVNTVIAEIAEISHYLHDIIFLSYALHYWLFLPPEGCSILLASDTA